MWYKMWYEMDEETKTFLRVGNLQAALDKLNETTVNDARTFRFLNMKKARLAAQLGKFFLADIYIALAKEKFPKDSQYYQILSEEAKIALIAKDYERAFSCCEEAIEDGVTQNGIINLTLGHAQEAIGHYYAALKSYQTAATTSSSSTVRQAGLFSSIVLKFSLGGFDLAERDLNAYIKEKGGHTKKSNTFLVGIYLRQGRYQEAEAHLEEFKKNNPEISYDEIFDIIIAKKLGKPLPARNSSYYSANQFIEYRKEEALEHIKQAHTCQSTGTRTSFSSEINIEDLFDDVKLQMVDATMEYNTVYDIYHIEYPNAGYDSENNVLHNIRVLTIPGTKDIITMYPTEKRPAKGKFNITARLCEQKKPVSRVERFNARLTKTSQHN